MKSVKSAFVSPKVLAGLNHHLTSLQLQVVYSSFAHLQTEMLPHFWAQAKPDWLENICEK